jgi:hypothetical protein
MSNLNDLLTSIVSDKGTMEKLIAGLPLEFKELKNPKVGIIIALHCCCNGPVGVNKNTNFPLVGAGSIKTLVQKDVSNKSWRGFCATVARWLVDNRVEIKCTSINLLRTYWPLLDWPVKIQQQITTVV